MEKECTSAITEIQKLSTSEIGLYPCSPRADSDELASSGSRLILYIDGLRDSIRIFRVDGQVLYAGWVIACASPNV